MRAGQFSYLYHFLFYGPRPNADYANLLIQQGRYAGVMMIACIAAFVLGGGRPAAGPGVRQARFWAGIAGLAFVMMLPVARPIWDLLPPLQAIQFPWRLNTLLTLATAALTALWAGSIRSRVSRVNGLALGVVCVVLIGQSLPTVATYLALTASPGAASMDKMLIQLGSVSEEARAKVLAAKSAIDVAEYRPRWVDREFYGTPQALRASLAKMQAVSRAQGVTILSRSPRRMVLATDMPAAGWVKLPHFYYPGWRAVTVASATPLPIRPSAEGLLEVKTAAGRQKIVLELETGIAEWMGWGISGFSIGLLGLFAGRALRRPRRPVRS